MILSSVAPFDFPFPIVSALRSSKMESTEKRNAVCPGINTLSRPATYRRLFRTSGLEKGHYSAGRGSRAIGGPSCPLFNYRVRGNGQTLPISASIPVSQT